MNRPGRTGAQEPGEPVGYSGVTSEPELVIVRLRPHGRVMFWPTIILFALIFGVGFFGGRFAEPWQNLVVLVAGVVAAILVWLVPMLTWLAHRYIITNRRVVIRRGLIVRHRHELLHSRGLDISLRQGLMQRMVGSGDVVISTGAERPVIIADVPAAALVQAALLDLAERGLNPIEARMRTEQGTNPFTSDSR